MKKAQQIKKVIEAMCKAKWVWTCAACRQFGESLDPIDKDEPEGRWTFEFTDDDVHLTVYADVDKPDKVDYIELTTDVVWDPENLSPKKYDELVKRFTKVFKTTVATIEAALGKPDYLGEPGDKGQRSDHDGIKQAYWKVKNGVLIAALKHEDKEVPIRNVVVVAPR